MSGTSRKATPWWLSGPALALFIALLVVPLLLTAVLSFNVYDPASGPRTGEFTLAHYAQVFGDDYYHGIFWRTFWISALVTLICVLIGAPEAYVLSRMRNPWRSVLLLVVLAPLLVSVVVRAFGWSMLLGPEGAVNALLQLVGIGPVKILYTSAAVVIALVHVMLPFMVIPVWTSLQKLDPGVENAALSLNATPFTTLRRIVLPQVMPGILSGSLIVFGLAASSFAIPGLLGGRRLKMVATVVYDEYLSELNWPLGAAVALTLLVANLVVMLSYNRLVEGRYKKALGDRMSRNGPIALAFNALVIAFMLAPLLVVCIVAFTPENTLTIPTTHFSLRWFEAVFAHPDFVQSFWNSLWLALSAATIATLLAVPAGMAITRYDFPGRDFLNGLFLSPLIIPHLVLGVALLRLFALVGGTGSFGWLVMAHALIVTPYTLRLVVAALVGFDRSAEQAALSLGASQATVFRRITLPMILPGVTGGWMLAFINSFDEVTMSIFVTSPSTVTLPVRMYMYATESIDPLMAAVSALMVAVTAVAMVVLDRLYGLDRVLVGRK